MKKRILALLLALCTVVSSASVFSLPGTAAEGESGAASPSERSQFPYWEYYVSDGLTMLLDGYNTDNGTIKVSSGAGTWTSRVANKSGNFAVATLAQSASANYWQAQSMGNFDNIGMGYDMTFAEFTAERSNNVSKTGSTVGIDLGIDNLPAGDYTVETVLNPRGVVEEDGTIGYFHGASSTQIFVWYGWSFGALKGWSFSAPHFRADDSLDASESYTVRYTMCASGVDYNGYSFSTDPALNVYGTPTMSTKASNKVITYTVTMDESVNGGVYTGVFASYADGVAKGGKNFNNSVQSSTYVPKSAVTSGSFFHVAYGWPSTVYAVRVYDRVLSSSEIAHNRGVDMLAYYDIAIDVPAYYRDSVMNALIAAAEDNAFVAGDGYLAAKMELQAEVDAILQNSDFSDGEYLALYEQNGLLYLLSAYAPNPTLDVAGGTWASANGNGKVATLYAHTNQPWSIRTLNGKKSGVGFVSSGVAGGGNDSSIRFDFADLPDGDFTFEMVATPDKLSGVTAGASGVPYTFAFGYMRGYGWPGYNASKPTTTYTNLDVLWYYSPSNHTATTNGTMWSIEDISFFTNNGKTFHYAITHDFTAGATAADNASVYTIYNDTVLHTPGASSTRSNPLTVSGSAWHSKNDLSAGQRIFRVMEGYPATIYAVRFYTRVLSASEQAWNRAVDIMAYYRLDVSALSALSKEDLDGVKAGAASLLAGAEFSAANYDEKKAEYQMALDGISGAVKAENFTVKDGLTIWLDLTTVDLAGGKWASKVQNPALGGSAKSVATLGGGVYSSTKTTGWRGMNGGVGYVGQNKNEVSANGIFLTPADLPGTGGFGDFTVEMLLNQRGLTNADGSGYVNYYNAAYTAYYAKDASGNRIKDQAGKDIVCLSSSCGIASHASHEAGAVAASGSQYGVNVGDSFAFGPFRTLTFIARSMNRNPATGEYGESPDSAQSRWYYAETPYTVNYCDWTGKNLVGFGDATKWIETVIKGDMLDGISTYRVTQDYTANADPKAATSTYVVYDGTSAKLTATVKGSDVVNGTGLIAKDAVDANSKGATKFQMMVSVPGVIYGVRVYDRVLSASEMRMNHFADIIQLFNLDISAWEKLDGVLKEETKVALADTFADVAFVMPGKAGYAEAKAEAQKLFDDLLATVEVEGKTYGLYVQNGLVALYQAYNARGGVDLANGTWRDMLGGRDATLVGGVKSASNKTGWYQNTHGTAESGIRYDQFAIGKASGIELDWALLPEGDYTVDMMVSPLGLTNEDGSIRYFADSNQYGESYSYGFRLGAFKGYVYPALRSPSNAYYGKYDINYASHEVMWYYASSGYNYTWRINDWCLYNASPNTTQDKSMAIGYTVTHDLTGASGSYSSTYAVLANGVAAGTWTSGTSAYVSKAKTQDQYFSLFYSFPATVYAVRVYDRVLSVSEQNQNHFADIALYYGLDLSDLFTLEGDLYNQAVRALAEAFKNVKGEEGAAYEAGLVAATELYKSTVYSYVQAKTGLYVADGLVALYEAFRDDFSDIRLASGAWLNKVSGESATLYGEGWKAWSAGGIGYIQHFDAIGVKTGLSLPVSLLDSDDYTVQILADVVGVREDNGGKLGDPVYLNQSQKNSYRFGMLKATLNVTPENATDLRYPHTWSQGSATLSDATPAFTASVDGVRLLSLEKVTVGDSVRYTFTGGATLTAPKTALAEDADFALFEANPVTVYSVRVYNRTLTEAEVLQNHFADLAAYYSFSIAPVIDMAEEEKAAFFAKFAEVDFSYTEEQANAIYKYHLGDTDVLASKILKYNGLSTRLSGEYGGIRSVFAVDERLVAYLESIGVRVAYGAIMAIGERNGVTVNTTGSLAVSGSYEAGFTAANRNSSIVTVYATDAESLAYTPTEKYVSKTAEISEFAYTTVLDANTNTADFYNIGLVYSGFLALNNGEEEETFYARAEGETFGKDTAKYGAATSVCEIATYFVNVYTGSNEKMYYYWSNARLNAIMQACGVAVTRTVIDEKALLAQRTEELNAALGSLLTTDMLECGTDSADGKVHAWVDWQEEHRYMRNGTLVDNIKAAYIYYPLSYDPSDYTDGELLLFNEASDAIAAGTFQEDDYTAEELALINGVKLPGGTVEKVVRFFCYVGIPDGASLADPDSYAGIVCTHGGGGHAYAHYAYEAMTYGYVSVAMDTEGYRAPDPTGGAACETSGEASEVDPLSHKGKDNWAYAKEELTQQWMYYAVSDVMLCNTLLRSFAFVDEDKVGLTGISWGGVITSCTIGFDSRLAFAVPVYCGYYIIENNAGLSTNTFAADLWQPTYRMEACTVPTLILTSQKDIWADIATSQHFYESLGEYGYITFVTNMGHSQQAGACPSEIYYFGRFVTEGDPYPGVLYQTEGGSSQVSKQDGREYTLSLSFPTTIKVPAQNGTATVTDESTLNQITVYYTTEALTYSNGKNVDQTWHSKDLTPYQEGGKWYVDVEIPEEAYLYYISFRTYSEDLRTHTLSTPYGNSNGYRGYLYSSTDVVVLGDGGIIAEE